MRKPLFSIIIPTFNREALIAQALQSVLDQSCDDWELIVIDDGSTDESYQVVQGFTDDRIKYHFQANKGKSGARNTGIRLSTGLYVCFLDSDDYYLSEHLGLLKRAIEQNDGIAAVFRTGMYSEGGGRQHRTPFYHPKLEIHPVHFFCQHMVGTNTLCIHRDILTFHQFDERFHFFQDTHLLLRILSQFSLFQVEEYTCVYRIHLNRSSYSLYQSSDPWELISNNVNAILDVFEGYPNLFHNLLSERLKRDTVSRKYMDHAAESLVGGYLKLSLKCFLKAISYDSKLRYWRRYLRYLPKIPLKLLFNYPPSH